MSWCPKCNAEIGQMETTCPKCGYDFPPDNDAGRRGSSVLGTLFRGVLTLCIFAAGFFVLSFFCPFGPIPTFILVLVWVVLIAWVFLSYRLGQVVSAWLSNALNRWRGRNGQA